MIDPFYNGILAVIVALWIAGLRSNRARDLFTFLRRFSTPLCLLVWAAFVVFAVLFVYYFPYFEEIHDIDDAVEAAVVNAENGVNPYEEYVVPRFKGKYAHPPEFEAGLYNYLPLDLITYMGAETLLGALGSPVWFVVTNLVFSGLALFILWRLVPVGWRYYVPIAGIIMLFYSFDNASLTLLLMMSSLFLHQRYERPMVALSIIVMGMAVMTKVYAALPFAVMVLFDLQGAVRIRDAKKAAEVILACSVAAVFSLLIMMPFGVTNVIDAAVLFHTSEAARVGTSTGGTVLVELLGGIEYYALLTIGILAAGLLSGMWLRNMNDRVLLVMILFSLVAVKSSLAPLTVAGIFLVLRLREKHVERVRMLAPPSVQPSTDSHETKPVQTMGSDAT